MSQFIENLSELYTFKTFPIHHSDYRKQFESLFCSFLSFSRLDIETNVTGGYFLYSKSTNGRRFTFCIKTNAQAYGLYE